jgi:hypothetical protein
LSSTDLEFDLLEPAGSANLTRTPSGREPSSDSDSPLVSLVRSLVPLPLAARTDDREASGPTDLPKKVSPLRTNSPHTGLLGTPVATEGVTAETPVGTEDVLALAAWAVVVDGAEATPLVAS